VNRVISVNVRLIGVFRELSGKNRFPIELEEPVAVRKVIHKLAETFSPEFKQSLVDAELNDPRPNALVLVNGKEISVLEGLETEVNKGDEVVIIPVSHGG
jgi:MoaD family protein